MTMSPRRRCACSFACRSATFFAASSSFFASSSRLARACTTTTATTINTGSGDTVTVYDIENPTTINLGSGQNFVTVYGADAVLTIAGVSGEDVLTLNLTSTTAAVDAEIENGTAANSGVLHAFFTNNLSADIDFSNLGTVNVLLGSATARASLP